jgi:hypothetical protein
MVATLMASNTLECLLMSIETQLTQKKIEFARIKKEYIANPSPDKQQLLDELSADLAKLKLDLTGMRADYRKAKKQEQKAEEELIEEKRKIALFGIFDQLAAARHITCIPEMYNKMDIWLNVKWWNGQKWVSTKESNSIFAEFRAIFEQEQYITDKHDTGEFNEYLQHHHCVHLDRWNQHFMFKNGILIDGTLHPNLPEYYTYKEYPFHLILEADLAKRVDLSFLTYHFQMVTADWEEICWWVGNCLRHMPMEYYLIFLGQPSGGKSPWAKAIKNIFGEVGTDGYDQLGVTGGLSTSWDKDINIDFDANIAYLSSQTISKIKQIYGDDPNQNVRLLYQNPFQTKISPYMLVLINTMPKIPQGVNSSALFKRTYICEFNRQLQDNHDFKEMVEDEEFNDLFGSYCYWRSFNPLLSNRENCNRRLNRLNDFIAQTERQWMDSAYPVRKAITYLLKRSTNPDDEIFQRTISIVVQQWFKDPKLNPLNASIPVNLIGEITEAIGLLGGDKCQREKKKAYEGVYWTKEGMEMYLKSTKDATTTTPSLPEKQPEQEPTKPRNQDQKLVFEMIRQYECPFCYEDVYTSLATSGVEPAAIDKILNAMLKAGTIYESKVVGEYEVSKSLGKASKEMFMG